MRKSDVNLQSQESLESVAVPTRLFSWTDPESGQRLTLRMRGSESFLQALEPLGFEALEARDGCADVEVESPESPRSWVSVKAHLSPEN